MMKLNRVSYEPRRGGALVRPRGAALATALALSLASALALFLPRGGGAQLVETPAASQPGLRVFLDCQGQVPCDRNHFRTEIQWVNWMNDRTDADVHLIITSENVGGGGRRFNLDFIGREAMDGLTDALTYTSSGTDVQIETVDGITQAMRLGLTRYAVEAGMARDFALTFVPPTVFGPAVAGDPGATTTAAAQTFNDPWRNWTFRMGLQGNLFIQELQSSHRINLNAGADRVTATWKANFGFGANFNREKRTLSNDRVVRNDRDGWNLNTLLVRSLSPNLSAGASLGGQSSVQNNRIARVTLTPAVEWNYYPYSEANRRQLIAHYGAGVQHNVYEEETVFGVTHETIPIHRVGVQYRAVEGWGNAGISLNGSQYLHRSGLYSFGASGNLSFRVIRGLELSLSLSGDITEDQIHIRASALSEEDILLGRVNLPSSYSYQASIGFNYRWGSSFSNVVNTRFPQSVR